MLTIDINELERLTNNFKYSFQDTEPQQALKIENFRTIYFSNDPHDVSDELPGNGCGQNMLDAYPSGHDPYEPAVTALFILLAQQTSELNMIDIGALWGHTSFVAASMFERSRTEMFEMNPITAVYLNKNIELNKSQHAIFNVHNILLSNRDDLTEVTFKHYSARYGDNEGGKPISALKIIRENLKCRIKRILHKKSKGMFKTQKIRIARLDSILIENEFVPNVIKIDVEGSQYNIIEGAKDTIQKHHPVVLVEFDNPDAANYIGRTNRELVELLTSWGYACLWGDHRHRNSHFQLINASTNLNIETNSLGIFALSIS